MLDVSRDIFFYRLPHFNERPKEKIVDVLIIHSMHSTISGSELDSQCCIQELDRHLVSSHYLIGREGDIWSLVEEEHRAWHAGESALPTSCGGLPGVNDFSIGIELVGREDFPFSYQQYDSLCELTADILLRYPIRLILGHSDIAQPPGRKADPGPYFSWSRFRDKLRRLGCRADNVVYSDQV